jgi:hypothetical protein
MIFLASIQVEPLSGSKMQSDQIAALVYVAIPAASDGEARKKLQGALKEDRYRLVNTEFIAKYDSFQWESTEDQAEYDKLAKRAALQNEVLYGPFYAWQNQSEE